MDLYPVSILAHPSWMYVGVTVGLRWGYGWESIIFGRWNSPLPRTRSQIEWEGPRRTAGGAGEAGDAGDAAGARVTDGWMDRRMEYWCIYSTV